MVIVTHLLKRAFGEDNKTTETYGEHIVGDGERSQDADLWSQIET